MERVNEFSKLTISICGSDSGKSLTVDFGNMLTLIELFPERTDNFGLFLGEFLKSNEKSLVDIKNPRISDTVLFSFGEEDLLYIAMDGDFVDTVEEFEKVPNFIQFKKHPCKTTLYDFLKTVLIYYRKFTTLRLFEKQILLGIGSSNSNPESILFNGTVETRGWLKYDGIWIRTKEKDEHEVYNKLYNVKNLDDLEETILMLSD